MTSMGESDFDFCDMSHILFGVGALYSWEPVLPAVTPVRDGAVVKWSMMLSASVTFFGWLQSLFSMLLLAVFRNEIERRQSRLQLFLFLGSTVVTPRINLISLTCGFLLSKFCRQP